MKENRSLLAASTLGECRRLNKTLLSRPYARNKTKDKIKLTPRSLQPPMLTSPMLAMLSTGRATIMSADSRLSRRVTEGRMLYHIMALVKCGARTTLPTLHAWNWIHMLILVVLVHPFA